LLSNWNISEYSFDFYVKWNTIGKSKVRIVHAVTVITNWNTIWVIPEQIMLLCYHKLSRLSVFWQLLLIGSSINKLLHSSTEMRKHFKTSILAAAKDKKWREKIILLTFKVIYRDTSNENQLQNCMWRHGWFSSSMLLAFTSYNVASNNGVAFKKDLLLHGLFLYYDNDWQIK